MAGTLVLSYFMPQETWKAGKSPQYATILTTLLVVITTAYCGPMPAFHVSYSMERYNTSAATSTSSSMSTAAPAVSQRGVESLSCGLGRPEALALAHSLWAAGDQRGPTLPLLVTMVTTSQAPDLGLNAGLMTSSRQLVS